VAETKNLAGVFELKDGDQVQWTVLLDPASWGVDQTVYLGVTGLQDDPLPPSPAQPGDWLDSLTSEQRKQIPLGQMMQRYFPDALALVAYHSFKGNEKHNPGEPLHWARGKSKDQEDCIARHLIGAGGRDTDGLRHSAGLAWRALALLQLEIEAAHGRGEEIF
jgi:hypothetical protein